MGVLLARLYFDFPAGFFAVAAEDLLPFAGAFLADEDVLLASAEVLLGGCFLAIDVLHRSNRWPSTG
jgi:hypothetical protein